MKFITDIQTFFLTESLKKTYYSDRKKCKSLDNVTNGYSIIRYDKLTTDMKQYANVMTLGHLRSVILSKDNKIVSYSPPKSIQWEDFVSNMINFNPLVQEYVEGTMINMFWDEYANSWEFSTKNTIGCKSHYQYVDFDILNQPKKQFLEMFNDAYYYNFLHYLQFDKECCYSFVLQHPNNRMVGSVTEPRLYLIASYKIIDTQIYYMDKELENIQRQVSVLIREKEFTHVLRFPMKYKFTSMENIHEIYENHPDYNVMGIVVKNPNTGEYTKVRNNTYLQVKELCGNHTSLLHRYISLVKNEKLHTYIDYYPEHINQFNAYYFLITNFCYTLDTYFYRIFITSGGHINNYFTRNKSHHVNIVYHLKKIYALYLQDNTVSVAEYVNNLDISNLYYALKQFSRFSNDVA